MFYVILPGACSFFYFNGIEGHIALNNKIYLLLVSIPVVILASYNHTIHCHSIRRMEFYQAKSMFTQCLKYAKKIHDNYPKQSGQH